MKLFSFVTIAVGLIPYLASAAQPVTGPATQSVIVESKPVVEDGASITISLKQKSISAAGQPHLAVRFSNPANDYINIYGVDAYWNWRIVFTSTDKQAAQSGPWVLKMASIPLRYPIAHKQIKAGESIDVAVNLNEPPFTFSYRYEGNLDDPRVSSVRHLNPGTYQVTMTIELKHPFGAGYHEWTGPLTTEGVELTVRLPVADDKAQPTPEQSAAYDAAISGVTAKLQPGGLWLNGGFPEIKSPREAKAEEVIDAAVNQTSLGSKAYRVLKVQPFARGQMPGAVAGSAALVQVGKAYKVVIFFPFEGAGWWSRFYDTELSPPATRPAAK